LGDGGPVEFGDGVEVSIGGGGQIIADGEVVDVLQLVTFPDPTYLRQAGRTTLAATENSGAPEALEPEQITLEPGALEMSNVNVVEEMVRMVEAQRAYEASSKTLMTHDELTGKLITSFGRTS